MKIIYQCEICGAESQDQEEIRQCEARGNKTRFPVGAGITFHLPPYRRPILAQIMGMRFGKGTHEVFYEVVSHDELLLPKDKGVMMTVSQERHCVKGVN